MFYIIYCSLQVGASGDDRVTVHEANRNRHDCTSSIRSFCVCHSCVCFFFSCQIEKKKGSRKERRSEREKQRECLRAMCI